MNGSDQSLQAAEHEVQRLMGHCVLRLQSYERLMKAILTEHDLSGSIAPFDASRAARAADINRKTLGTLVGQLLGSFLVADGAEGRHSSAADESNFAVLMQIALPADDLARTERDLRALVALRNDLVHGFLDQHDLTSLAGYETARLALVAASDRITQALSGLSTWADDLTQLRAQMAEHLRLPEVQDFIVYGRVPWPITTIVQALQRAEAALAVDGWVPVAGAVAWMSEQYPDEQPDGYACRSWRQVIHDSRLFDLRYRQINDQRTAWYRSKIDEPN